LEATTAAEVAREGGEIESPLGIWWWLEGGLAEVVVAEASMSTLELQTKHFKTKETQEGVQRMQ